LPAPLIFVKIIFSISILNLTDEHVASKEQNEDEFLKN
jgi:hypothetical protein